ncbi:MAG: DUF2202 domain-containing protein [Saprospiraceae bacterium]|nr:DUF2202 domain-containing protein [Saprospiraceae bacterium]
MRHLILLLSMISVFMSTAYLPLKQMYTPSKELTESEKAGLLLMREEEKLAFEVYTTMYKKWDHHVFYNILQSEERHGSMVKDLIVKYKLQDPYSEEFGKYTSPQLQQQYNNLITKGNGSLTDAFTAGAMIEDMDVSDLDRLLAETKNPDLLKFTDILTMDQKTI